MENIRHRLLSAPSLAKNDELGRWFRAFINNSRAGEITADTVLSENNMDQDFSRELISYYFNLQRAISLDQSIEVQAYLDTSKLNRLYDQNYWRLSPKLSIDWPLIWTWGVALPAVAGMVILTIKLPAEMPLVPAHVTENGQIWILSKFGIRLSNISRVESNWSADYGGQLFDSQELIFYRIINATDRVQLHTELFINQLRHYILKHPNHLLLFNPRGTSNHLYLTRDNHTSYGQQLYAANEGQLIEYMRRYQFIAKVIPEFWAWVRQIMPSANTTVLIYSGQWFELSASTRPLMQLRTKQDLAELINYLANDGQGYSAVRTTDGKVSLYRLPRVTKWAGSLLNECSLHRPEIRPLSTYLLASNVTNDDTGYYQQLIVQEGAHFSMVAQGYSQEQMQVNRIVPYEVVTDCPCSNSLSVKSYGFIQTPSTSWLTLSDYLIFHPDLSVADKVKIGANLLELITTQVKNNYYQNQLDVHHVLVGPEMRVSLVASALSSNSTAATWLYVTQKSDLLGHPRVPHTFLQYYRLSRVLLRLFDNDIDMAEIVNQIVEEYNQRETDEELTQDFLRWSDSIFVNLEMPTQAPPWVVGEWEIFEAKYQRLFANRLPLELLREHNAQFYLLLAEYAPMSGAFWYYYVSTMANRTADLTSLLRTQLENYLLSKK